MNENQISESVNAPYPEMLTTDQATEMLGISKAYLFKLTSRKLIPHFKPMGKKIYFDRSQLIHWMRSNPVATTRELNARASEVMMNNARKQG